VLFFFLIVSESSFWQNASISMFRLLFFLAIQTHVCRFHFKWKELSCELIWSAIWQFSRNFLWIVYKNYKTQEISVFIWDFDTLFNEEWFQFISSSFLFHFDQRSDLNILSRAQRIRICQCRLADLRRTDAAAFSWHALCASFWNC
jgi:hypothetical protein